jgi:hypothetical protein
LVSSYHPAVRRAFVVLAAASVLVAAGCSSGGSSRPTTAAQLRIVTPAPDRPTVPDPALRLELTKAKIVPGAGSGAHVRGDQGHIHVSVDGRLIAMAYTLDQQLPPMPPGRHTVVAEFVAADHAPFANRVVAAVSFDVR